jgi:hypothetical protein
VRFHYNVFPTLWLYWVALQRAEPPWRLALTLVSHLVAVRLGGGDM